MEKELGKIKKNDNTDIVLRIDDFGGRTGLTIREFVSGDRYTGFTKSGVRILADDFSKFKNMINSVTEDDLKAPEGSDDSEQEKLNDRVKTEKPGEAAGELPDY